MAWNCFDMIFHVDKVPYKTDHSEEIMPKILLLPIKLLLLDKNCGPTICLELICHVIWNKNL